jgi:hypothetical protein
MKKRRSHVKRARRGRGGGGRGGYPNNQPRHHESLDLHMHSSYNVNTQMDFGMQVSSLPIRVSRY